MWTKIHHSQEACIVCLLLFNVSLGNFLLTWRRHNNGCRISIFTKDSVSRCHTDGYTVYGVLSLFGRYIELSLSVLTIEWSVAGGIRTPTSHSGVERFTSKSIIIIFQVKDCKSNTRTETLTSLHTIKCTEINKQ